MFDRLQKKWKVSPLQLALILCTFAIGGSACGYVAKQIMPLFGIKMKLLWLLVYIMVVTLLWPLMVLLISIPLGQYAFFKLYIRKILKRFRLIR